MDNSKKNNYKQRKRKSKSNSGPAAQRVRAVIPETSGSAARAARFENRNRRSAAYAAMPQQDNDMHLMEQLGDPISDKMFVQLPQDENQDVEAPAESDAENGEELENRQNKNQNAQDSALAQAVAHVDRTVQKAAPAQQLVNQIMEHVNQAVANKSVAQFAGNAEANVLGGHENFQEPSPLFQLLLARLTNQQHQAVGSQWMAQLIGQVTGNAEAQNGQNEKSLQQLASQLKQAAGNQLMVQPLGQGQSIPVQQLANQAIEAPAAQNGQQEDETTAEHPIKSVVDQQVAANIASKDNQDLQDPASPQQLSSQVMEQPIAENRQNGNEENAQTADVVAVDAVNAVRAASPRHEQVVVDVKHQGQVTGVDVAGNEDSDKDEEDVAVEDPSPGNEKAEDSDIEDITDSIPQPEPVNKKPNVDPRQVPPGGIIIEPSIMKFTKPYDVCRVMPLKIQNISFRSVAFKMISQDPARFQFEPTMGILKGGEYTHVDVITERFKYRRPFNEKIFIDRMNAPRDGKLDENWFIGEGTTNRDILHVEFSG